MVTEGDTFGWPAHASSSWSVICILTGDRYLVTDVWFFMIIFLIGLLFDCDFTKNSSEGEDISSMWVTNFRILDLHHLIVINGELVSWSLCLQGITSTVYHCVCYISIMLCFTSFFQQRGVSMYMLPSCLYWTSSRAWAVLCCVLE